MENIDRRRFLFRLAGLGAAAAVAIAYASTPEKKSTERAISLEPLKFDENDTPEIRISHAERYLANFVKRCEMYPEDQPENTIAQYNANVEGTFPIFIFDEDGTAKINDVVKLFTQDKAQNLVTITAKTGSTSGAKVSVKPNITLQGNVLGWGGYELVVDTNAKTDAELGVRILDGFITALQEQNIVQIISSKPELVSQIQQNPRSYAEIRKQVIAEENAAALVAVELDPNASIDTRRAQRNLLLILFIQHASKLNKSNFVLPSTNEEYTRLLSKFNETRSGRDPEWLAAHPL